jgi:hypothetical protein
MLIYSNGGGGNVGVPEYGVRDVSNDWYGFQVTSLQISFCDTKMIPSIVCIVGTHLSENLALIAFNSDN